MKNELLRNELLTSPKIPLTRKFNLKLALPAMMLILLFWSCKKKDTPDYASLISGTWVNTLVDNKAILTDASFVCEFGSNNVQTYATGYILDENNKTWIKSDTYNYSVSDKKITINGVNFQGINFYMEFEILSVDERTLTYSVSKFLIDGVEYPDPKIYTNKKVSADLRNQFVGTWYGKSTTPGSADSSYHYWQYFENGHFDYYYQDEAGKWISKQDNEGYYFLYGDLLASNYTNDLLSGVTGKAFECWNISINGNAMSWTGIRENGLITSFQMVKVEGPPV
ncbi:MAG: hypothetical protein WCP32_11680 [Bacteroidota bacterium]